MSRFLAQWFDAGDGRMQPQPKLLARAVLGADEAHPAIWEPGLLAGHGVVRCPKRAPHSIERLSFPHTQLSSTSNHDEGNHLSV